jgi:hypothetical protein
MSTFQDKNVDIKLVCATRHQVGSISIAFVKVQSTIANYMVTNVVFLVKIGFKYHAKS